MDGRSAGEAGKKDAEEEEAPKQEEKKKIEVRLLYHPSSEESTAGIARPAASGNKQPNRNKHWTLYVLLCPLKPLADAN